MRGGRVDGQELSFRAVVGQPIGPPPDATLTRTIGRFGEAYAIVGLTPVAFDASLSSGDGLSYFIEFGDGELARARRAEHVVDDGTYEPDITRFSPLLTVVDRYGRVDSEGAPFWGISLIEDFRFCCAGWVVLPGNAPFPYRVLAFRSRDGRNLYGAFYSDHYRHGSTVPCVGVLSGERDIRITIAALGIEFEGHFEIGRVRSDIWRLVLTETKGPDIGLRLELAWDDGPG